MKSLQIAKESITKTTNSNGRNLDSALDSLNQLVEQGFEFPNAISLVLDEHDVDQDELTAAYDSNC